MLLMAFPSDTNGLIMSMFRHCTDAEVQDADNMALSFLREDDVSRNNAEFLYRQFFRDYMRQFRYFSMNKGLLGFAGIIRSQINEYCADRVQEMFIYHQSLIPFNILNPGQECREYVQCELVLDVPLCVKRTGEWGELPWSEEVHDRICNNAGVMACHAMERGFSVPYDRDGNSGRANHQFADGSWYTAMEYQGQRDLRFNTDRKSLWMKDHMPWSRDELNRLIAALQLEYIGVTVKDIKTIILE